MNAVITQTHIQNFGGKTLESYAKAVILINMNTPTDLTDVVKFQVKCFPGYPHEVQLTEYTSTMARIRVIWGR